MVRLSNIKKDVLKYYGTVEQTWTTKDYHCVYVIFYDEDIPCIEYTFYSLQEYLDEVNDNEYDSVEIKYDPITIQFPCTRKSNLRY